MKKKRLEMSQSDDQRGELIINRCIESEEDVSQQNLIRFLNESDKWVEGHICVNKDRIKFVKYHTVYCSMCRCGDKSVNVVIHKDDVDKITKLIYRDKTTEESEMDQKNKAFYKVKSDGTPNDTIITDSDGKPLSCVRRLDISVEAGTPYVRAQIEVLDVELDVDCSNIEIEKTDMGISEIGGTAQERFLMKKIIQFMDNNNLRWKETKNGEGSALLEVLLFDLVKKCIKGLANGEHHE